ncbi:MAG TPA: hypothetical protein VM658_03990 [bacterium]|nr:hypothetical protein [bacterium]
MGEGEGHGDIMVGQEHGHALAGEFLDWNGGVGAGAAQAAWLCLLIGSLVALDLRVNRRGLKLV